MKKSLLLKKSIITLLPISLGLGVVLGAAKNSNKEVKGYTAASLPTTINLNDTSASNIRSYYSSLNNLSTTERQGTNLLKNLKNVLKNGQKYFSYEDGTNVWRMYEITDRDWDKSPASSTTYGTYNSSTNTITNYTYGSSASSSKNNPYIHALYINRDVNNQTTAWDNHNQDEWGINREHVWAKAEGFDTSGAGGARGDPMHLMAGNGYSNNIHSNYFFGYVDTSSSYTDCGTKYSNQSGNLRGTSKTLKTGTVFEPQDCDKGDIARAIFYMVARYNYLSGSDSDGIDSNNPNLTLTQNVSDWKSSGYTCTTTNPGKMGIMTDLLAWHHADPVDEYEIHRNNLLYTNFTNNRNPFIDFPEWADFIWGSVNYNGSTYVSHSTTPTGYATPSSDTINGYNSGGGESETVSVTGVTLNKESTSILVGESEVLSATVAPINATNQAVSWTSSNTSVATVSSSGRVSAVAEGSATITVTTDDGSYTATCTVTVETSGGGGGGQTDTSTVSVTLSSGAFDTDHITWTAADGNISITQSKGNATTAVNSSYISAPRVYKGHILSFEATSGYKISSISITYDGTYYGNSMTAGTEISNNQVTDSPSAVARTWSSTSGGTHVISSVSSDGLSAIHIQNVASGSNTQLRPTAISITYVSGSSSSTKVLESITLDTSDVEKSFYQNEEFDYSGLSVTANYEDGTSDFVSNYTVSSPDMTTTGQKTVNVSYTEGEKTASASYSITVLSTSLESIAVSGQKTSYYQGDDFEKPTVTATYSNGYSSDVTESATFTGYNMSTLGNQTVTVSYTFNGTTKTTSYQITVNEMPEESGTATNPYTVEQARAAITAAGDSTLADKYTRGIICQIDSYNSSYHSITYWISDDGTTTNMLEVYSGKGIDGANFSSESDLTVGDIVVVVGELKKYGSTFEYNYNNQLVSRVPYVNVNAYSLITNPSELLTGDEIIFAYTKTSSGYQSSTTHYTISELDNNVLRTTTITKSDSTMVKNTNTMTFTIVKTSEGYRFKNASNEYLAWCSGTDNYSALETESTLSDRSLFNITYSNSQMSIIGAKNDGVSSPRNSLKFYSRNSNIYFSFFVTNTTSTSAAAPSIYKKTTQVEADAWSETFLNSTSDGTTCNVNNWSSLASSYNELSGGAKDEIINVEANASELYSLRAQAMARYDYFMTNPKYNQGEHFIVGRQSSSAIRPSQLLTNNDNDQTIVLVCVCTIVSLTSLTSLLVIKKRKNRRV